MAWISYNARRCASERGRTLFDFADQLAVQVPTSCGRNGICHECIVEIKRGAEALVPAHRSRKISSATTIGWPARRSLIIPRSTWNSRCSSGGQKS